MAIQNENRKTAIMQGDGTNTKFPFDFRIYDKEDLKIYVKVGSLNYELKEINVDYELRDEDLHFDSNGNITGGDITYPKVGAPLTNDDYIYAIRETPRTQVETSETVSFQSSDIERGLDKSCMEIQELSEDVSRCIKVQPYQDISPDELVQDIYNAAGDAQQAANDASASAINASTSETNAQKWAEGSDADVTPLGGTHSSKGWANEAASHAADAASAVNDCQTITDTAVASINRPLLSFMWTDHLLNNQSWLRADTNSWQDGTVYTEVYNHLIDDTTNGTSQTETIAGHTITYTLADDGHKIVSDAYASAVEGLYNDTSVAWYYILDLVNQRFKLPRTKWGFVGLRDTVGKYVPESLPNITGNVGITLNKGIPNDTPYDGAFKIGTSIGSRKYSADSANNADSSLIGFDASLSSSTYQDNAKVQPPATQMYLYFYVGNFSQSATEQTAGLNSELFNNKVDTDLSNLNTTISKLNLVLPQDIDYVVESKIATTQDQTWWRKYRSGWIEMGGTVYNTSTNPTITFPKEMSSLWYDVNVCIINNGDTSNGYGYLMNAQTTYMQVASFAGSDIRWSVKGQGVNL